MLLLLLLLLLLPLAIPLRLRRRRLCRIIIEPQEGSVLPLQAQPHCHSRRAAE
jgi:hypothetical protein